MRERRRRKKMKRIWIRIWIQIQIITMIVTVVADKNVPTMLSKRLYYSQDYQLPHYNKSMYTNPHTIIKRRIVLSRKL
jgi:hypothetical protein